MNDDLSYPEICLIYPITGVDDGGRETLGTAVEVPCLSVFATGYAHADRQDAITSTTSVFFPSDNTFIADDFYRLEGMTVRLDPFGSSYDQYFKISTVTPARDTLLGNTVKHVEAALEKITGNVGVS